MQNILQTVILVYDNKTIESSKTEIVESGYYPILDLYDIVAGP